MFSRVFNFPQGFWKKLALFSFSIFFISAGIDHFTNKETYESTWLNEVIPSVLPDGITLNITNRIAGGGMDVFAIEGEAKGINGEYNNNYAMVMRLKDKKIIFFQEYMSDLLAETRLHKKKIVDIN